MVDYLNSLVLEKLKIVIDMSNALSKTSLAWIVKYELSIVVELLLRFEAYSN